MSDRPGTCGSRLCVLDTSLKARLISRGRTFRLKNAPRGRSERRFVPVAQSSHMLLARSCSVVILLAASLAAQKQPFDVQALLKIQRIQEPQLSPDGRTVAFTVQSVDMAQNSKPKQIDTVPVNGGAPRQITTQGTDNERPQWSPDSSRIAFISDR